MKSKLALSLIAIALLFCANFAKVGTAEKPHTCFGCFGDEGKCTRVADDGDMSLWITGEKRQIPCPESSPELGYLPVGYLEADNYFIPDTPEPITVGTGVVNGKIYYSNVPGELIYCYETEESIVVQTYQEWLNLID